MNHLYFDHESKQFSSFINFHVLHKFHNTHSIQASLTIPMGYLAGKLFNTNYTLKYKLCNRNIHTIKPKHTPAGTIENVASSIY